MTIGRLLSVAVVLSAFSCETNHCEPGKTGNGNDPRQRLPGLLLGQPLHGGATAGRSGGLSPCAENEDHARRLVGLFLSVPSAPYSPEALSAASVAEHPFIFEVDFPAGSDFPTKPEQRGYQDGRGWQVVRCARFDYYNQAFGLSVQRWEPYPYAGVDPAHLKFFQQVDGISSDPGRPATKDSVAHLDPSFVNGLPLAKSARPVEGLGELHEVVDFLYQVGRIPLEGFNQEGELVRREALDLGDVLIVEDLVRWVVHDDVLPPGGRLDPPSEKMLLHVVIYATASRQLAHYQLPDPESRRDRPHVRLVSPGGGFALGARRPLVLRGAVAHGREILSPKRMEWISDRDGLIATGLGASLSAGELSIGDHEITFRVCDLQARCDEDTVRIRVQER